jgi:tyrosinase
MGGLMGDPSTAGLDPIFWLHHANIDRLWNRWADDSDNVPPGQSAWRNQRYGFFDQAAAAQSLTSKDVLSTVQQLNYRYDDDPKPFEEIERVPKGPIRRRPPAELVAASEGPTRLVGRPVSVPVVVDEKADVRRLQQEMAPTRRIVLSVEHVDAKVNPGVVYGVYLEGLHPEKPVHVGNVSLFGIERIHRREGVEEAHDLRLDFDVTDVVGDQVDKLRDVRVRFAPIRLDAESRRRVAEEATEVHPPIEVGRVSISVD